MFTSSAPSSASMLRSTEPSKTAAPTPNSTSSPKKISTQPHKDPTIVGYLHNVSPVKKSAKGSEYFSFTVQEKEKKIKALCFSPRKHKANVETTAESGTPCKLTKFTYHATEEDVIWVNAATQINHALERTLIFLATPITTKLQWSPQKTLRIFKFVKVSQFVVWFFLEIEEQSLSLQKLISLKGKDPLSMNLEIFQSQFGTTRLKVQKRAFLKSITFVFDSLKAKNTYPWR